MTNTNTGTGITDAGSRPRSPAHPAVRRRSGLRKNSLAISIMLLAQYGLGINLYAQIPKPDQGGGLAVALGRALSNPPAVLAICAALGLLLLAAAINALARAIRARNRPTIVTSTAGLAAIAGAAFSGAAFVDNSQAGPSMAMAALTAIALLCYLLNLFTLGTPARPDTTPGLDEVSHN